MKKTTIQKYLTPVLSVAILLSVCVGISFASPANYNPGQTLTPTCAPGSNVGGVPCTVGTIGYDSAGNVLPIVLGDKNSSTVGFNLEDSNGTSLFKLTNNGAVTINSAYTLPTSDGTAGQVLLTDGAGKASWQTVGDKTVKVHLTSAQILNLPTTPVEVIPAPGAGKIIEVTQAIQSVKFGTTPYTVDFGAITLDDTASQTPIYRVDASQLQQPSDTLSQFSPVSSNPNQITPNGSVSAAYHFGSVITGGDGSVDLYITYRVLTL